MTVSGRGKEDQGSGKGGPKRLRKGLRRNTRRSLKPANRRWVARRRLGEKIGPWLKVAGTGRRQGTGLGRMGSDPGDQTERGSPPDGVSGHRRPPSHPPDGDYAKGGDSGVNHGSPEFPIEHRDEPPRDSVTDAEIPADDRQFPVSEVDRGGRSGSAAGGKLRRVSEGRGRTSGVKAGPAVEGNIRLHLFTPKVKIADERNQGLKGANRGSGGLKKWNIMPQFFSRVTATSAAAIGAIIRTLRTRSILRG
jgi:hypothetical protein